VRFTILIPSFNRAEYLDKTLQTCINQAFEDVEFLVCDDASTDYTAQIVQSYVARDSRFRFISQESNIGMLGNFEHGLSMSRGDYILALGSDDALMPECLTFLNSVLRETDSELITWPTAAYFYASTKDPVGQLVIPNRAMTGKQTRISSSEFLQRQAKELTYVADEDCPMIYVKALASRRLIESVKQRNGGAFYASSTPDGFSGIVLAGETQSFLKIDKILTVHGVSPSSAGVNYISARSQDHDLSAKFFSDSGKSPMHDSLGGVPYSPLIALMTADFLLTARDIPGWMGEFGDIDFKNLIRRSLYEVQDGLMGDEKVKRELEIIRQVSQATGNEAYFTARLERLRRNRRSHLRGDAISPRLVYLDASKCDVNNVFEATYFVKFWEKRSWFSMTKRLIHGAYNSLRYAILRHVPGQSLKSYLD
jgi:glycosyltransferase involved in cell wall biosynthesis